MRRDYVRDAGGTWTSAAEHDMVGLHLGGWARYMHDRLGVALPPERIAREVEARIESIYRDGVPFVAGAYATLERCAAIWPLALATGSTHRLIDLVLDLGRLRSFFGAIASVDDVGRAKPAPDVYLHAAALLGVDPARCVAVEDSASGIRSARSAGMGVIAILDAAYPVDGDLAKQVDGLVPRLDALTPEIVRAAARRT